MILTKSIIKHSALILALFVAPCFADKLKNSDVKEVSWADLKGKFEFEDPFEKLTSDQLYHLSIVARIKAMEASETRRSKVTEGMRKEMKESEQILAEDNIDINAMFAKRAEIRKLRRKRAMETVPELNNKVICIHGFLLPLEFKGKKVTEFLLVPWVGACIHTPPPPPNQIVYVLPSSPVVTKGVFEPITVTGKMTIKGMKKNLFLVDGSADINVSYSLAASDVSKYKSEK